MCSFQQQTNTKFFLVEVSEVSFKFDVVFFFFALDPCGYRVFSSNASRTLWNDAIHVSRDGRIGRALLQYLRSIAGTEHEKADDNLFHLEFFIIHLIKIVFFFKLQRL